MSDGMALKDPCHNVPSTPRRSLTKDVRPRTIWAYWAQGYSAMPELFKLCVATWQHFNPHWDIRILQKSNLHEYLSAAELPNKFDQMTSHQTASDSIRLALMSRYGGVWLDVSIILCTGLDNFCWNAIASGSKRGAVFYHPHYGTEAFAKKDLTESWYLATLPGNPFFLQWRDLLRELMHNRVGVDGVLKHPLYEGFDLSGIHRLNQQFQAGFDFREYLAIHAMCRRLIERDAQSCNLWQSDFLRFDAASTAFRLQLQAEAAGRSSAELLLGQDNDDSLLEGIPLVKLTTPHYGPLLFLKSEQLQDRRHLLGRLLTPQATNPGLMGRSGPAFGAARSPTHQVPFGARAGGVRKISCSRSLVAVGFNSAAVLFSLQRMLATVESFL